MRSPPHPWEPGTGLKEDEQRPTTTVFDERHCPICRLVHLTATVRVPEIPRRRTARSFWVSRDGTVQRGGMAPPCCPDSSTRSLSANESTDEAKLMDFLESLSTARRRSRRVFAKSGMPIVVPDD